MPELPKQGHKACIHRVLNTFLIIDIIYRRLLTQSQEMIE